MTDRYAVFVDISAKLESWDKSSVVAVANDHSRALVVSPEAKQAARRLLGDSELPQYTLMALLAYMVIVTEIDRISSITLDRDYSGQVAERKIRRLLLEHLRRHRPKFKASAVRIQNIAGSKADKLARAVYKGRLEADGEVTIAEIQAVLQAQE